MACVIYKYPESFGTLYCASSRAKGYRIPACFQIIGTFSHRPPYFNPPNYSNHSPFYFCLLLSLTRPLRHKANRPYNSPSTTTTTTPYNISRVGGLLHEYSSVYVDKCVWETPLSVRHHRLRYDSAPCQPSGANVVRITDWMF